MDEQKHAPRNHPPVVDAQTAADKRPERTDPSQRPFPQRLIVGGFALVGFWVSSFALWSTLAPVEGAVIAPGIVSVAGYRKQVQHLEGGIVEDILVRDGDRVTEGQPLVQLRDVQPAAELRQLEWQHVEAKAIVARLLAEQTDSREIDFPDDLLARDGEPSVASLIAGQRGILLSRQALIQEKLSVLDNKIIQAQEEIKGLEGKLQAKRRQRGYAIQELESVEEALTKSLVPESHVLTLRQRLAEIDGDVSGYRSQIARIRQNVLEMRLQISEERAAYTAEVSEQLHAQRARLFELSQQIVAARDVLRRTRIVSPIDGVVVNLQIHTKDGVITAGQPLLEVVPVADDLVIHAFVDPEDIDEVVVGMPADVRLTSISRRSRVPLTGVVSQLSADRLSDPETGRDYYQAQIELVKDSEGSVKSTMVAGMGADVFIRTGARTFIDYLLSPITGSIQHGLREK